MKISFALEGNILMKVTLSGRTGKETISKLIPLKDGSGDIQITEASLAVKVSSERTDWYKLKFLGDRLNELASYLNKGMLLSLVGDLTFETWIDDDGIRKSKGIVTVKDIQLPPVQSA
jgi:single-stranded DNA-binding protein